MARIAVIGLAKSGTTGLWSALVNSYPRKYLRFFEGQFLPTRYNKYFGRTKSSEKSANIIDKQIIGPNFRLSALYQFEKIIWIPRDPRDRLVSYILYRHYDHRYQDDAFVTGQLNLLQRKESDPSTVTLRELETRLQLPNPDADSAFFWGDHLKWSTINSLADDERLCILKYEDFVEENFLTLEQFLEIRLSRSKKVPRQFERVVRSKSHGFWQHWFTQEDVKIYEPLFRDFLAQYGYSNNWSLAERPSINPAHGSAYVRRIVNERRRSQGLNSV